MLIKTRQKRTRQRWVSAWKNNPFITNALTIIWKTLQSDALWRTRRKICRTMRNSFPDPFGRVVAKPDPNGKKTKYISGYRTPRWGAVWLQVKEEETRSRRADLFLTWRAEFNGSRCPTCLNRRISCDKSRLIFIILEQKFRLLQQYKSTFCTSFSCCSIMLMICIRRVWGRGSCHLKGDHWNGFAPSRVDADWGFF